MGCCSSCGSDAHATNKCYEARFSIALKSDNRYIIGSLDGRYFSPIDLNPAVKKLETNTTLKYNPELRSIVFENERFKNSKGPADSITTREILSGASLSELGGVLPLVNKGLASVTLIEDELKLQTQIPVPIENGELASGFIAFVDTPNDGTSNYRLITPNISGDTDTILVGHPDGGIEFVVPIDSPLIMETDDLTSSGAFSGSPSTSSGTWRYQQMGQTDVITNLSGSKVEVVLELRWSMQTGGTRSGFYATLVNGGSDYQQAFTDGLTSQKQEGYPGGQGRWTCILEPNQRCQFRFGGWTNAAGNMVITVGSVSENAGSTVQQVQLPTISVRRLI